MMNVISFTPKTEYEISISERAGPGYIFIQKRDNGIYCAYIFLSGYDLDAIDSARNRALEAIRNNERQHEPAERITLRL